MDSSLHDVNIMCIESKAVFQLGERVVRDRNNCGGGGGKTEVEVKVEGKVKVEVEVEATKESQLTQIKLFP